MMRLSVSAPVPARLSSRSRIPKAYLHHTVLFRCDVVRSISAARSFRYKKTLQRIHPRFSRTFQAGFRKVRVTGMSTCSTATILRATSRQSLRAP